MILLRMHERTTKVQVTDRGLDDFVVYHEMTPELEAKINKKATN